MIPTLQHPNELPILTRTTAGEIVDLDTTLAAKARSLSANHVHTFAEQRKRQWLSFPDAPEYQATAEELPKKKK